MWTDGAAITKQLSDEDVERASTRRRPYSFLHDLDPAARERLDELEEQIDSGKVKLRNGRPGRPATDSELRHRRRELPLPKVHEDLRKPSDPKPNPRPTRPTANDDQRYLVWGLLHSSSRASAEAIGKEAGVSAETVRSLAARYGVSRSPGRKPKAPPVPNRKGQLRRARLPRPERATRERIVDLVLGGYTVEQVALRLRIPEATVRFRCRRSAARILSAADERREVGPAGPIARDDPARAQGAA